MAKKDIVSEHHRRGRPVEEILGQQKRLREALRFGLFRICERNAPLCPIPEGAFELIAVLRGGDDENVANPRQHQNA